ncbi:hypothetical protein AB1Y20_018935 [Prymnesium parvum]|uniref:ATP-dependent RNA helicase HrpB C-terminal domain-containing protein n=1 Tax=Prymnesium parvum TaxID=97485 RepID=A0AB34JRS4_PRYPA
MELLARVRFLRLRSPEEGWPRWTEAHLLERAEEWLAPALDGAASLKALARADIARLLESTLTYEQQDALRRYAPRVLELPSGREAPLRYAEESQGLPEDGGSDSDAEPSPPVLAAKLQEWFGCSTTPLVGPPRAPCPVVLHLLSPAQRPLAITQNLATFWGEPYLQLRAEVRSKYAKHPWPDDPASAEPTRLSKKALLSVESGRASGDAKSKPNKKKGKKRR